jgi:NAD+ kinase
VLLGDRSRAEIADVLDALREGLAGRVQIAGEFDSNNDPLPDDLRADFAIAVGGDGTFISQARRVVDRDMPLVGVNVGRLGFLAEFDVETLCERALTVFGPDPPVTHAMILHADVERGGTTIASGTAINDCVVTSAAPRMIELTLSLDGSRGPAMTGDGVIVATPTGSTAYNASAGGPILHRAVEAMVITPLAAQSLAFRPIVMEAGCEIAIRIDQAEEGARLVQDGQIINALVKGDVVKIRRHAKSARFVIRPETAYWRILIDKLRWALPPRFREPTVDA